jgi:hypothetical protein
MSDKIVRRPPLVQITGEDYEIAIEARRANAARRRRKDEIAEAEQWERKAEEIVRAGIAALARCGRGRFRSCIR